MITFWSAKIGKPSELLETAINEIKDLKSKEDVIEEITNCLKIFNQRKNARDIHIKRIEDFRTTNEYKELDNYTKQVRNDEHIEDIAFINNEMVKILTKGKLLCSNIVDNYLLDLQSTDEETLSKEDLKVVSETIQLIADHFYTLYNDKDSQEFMDTSTMGKIELFKNKILDKIFSESTTFTDYCMDKLLAIADNVNKERPSKEFLEELNLIIKTK